ncbi:hypothetical protein SFRURICE_019731 [Spodoptera frugiperda]|nr:hypothetical protein SFRURICE_019731 [Spodoptera frugiperda]
MLCPIWESNPKPLTRQSQLRLRSQRGRSELINRVYTVKDLGVIFDPRLNFHEHMRLLTTDSYRRLGFVIRNMREFDNPKAIKLVYMALVRSKLETASIVWNPHESTYALLLEKVQKAFLSTLRGQSDCPELVAQVVRLFVPAVLKHQLRPRKHPLLAVPAARTVAHANSPLVRALTMINALLTSAPECDLYAARWKDVFRIFLNINTESGFAPVSWVRLQTYKFTYT